MVEPTDHTLAATGGELLSIRGLSKQFGGLTALDGLDLAVRREEIRAIIGPNGSGKSTLINVISGVYTPTAGEVVLDGAPITALPPHERTRRGIARTFQTIRLFKALTVLQNVLIGRDCRTRAGLLRTIVRSPLARQEERQAREQALAALQFVGLADKATWEAGKLAHGQQRLVEIARALATDPRLLLLDEPAAGLHPVEVQELMALIRTVRDQGRAVVLVEHNMRLVMDISDRITVLDFGKVIAEGTAGTVRGDPRVIEAYLGRGAAAAAAHLLGPPA